jgi:hypothetical protein
MESDKYRNVRIVLRLKGAKVLIRDVTSAFDDLEATLYQTDRDLVEKVAESIKIDSLIKDAALERVRRYRGQRIQLKHIGEGSFVFELALSGVAVWVLKETVGECIKKGWKDSSAYSRLSDAVKDSIENLAENIVLTMRNLGRKISQADTKLLLPPEANEPTILIDQSIPTVQSDKQVPSLAEAIAQLEKRE